ncbi:DNA dC-_dU-editing enzyme APOBEC-3C-like [Saccopteryx bilineata]|uniref:DNA dC->dU-editing enzyme APOBEC-3C-like n=1 Tax=Saccopteryx bilineata TaxID=59482 RepID=UPI00338EA220
MCLLKAAYGWDLLIQSVILCFFTGIPPRILHTCFRNLLDAPGQNATYLCFPVEKWQRGLFRLFHKEIFPNPFYPETLHAELCFLDWFCNTILPLGGRYQVFWYISWSPCSHCAAEVADFLQDHENVNLKFEYCWDFFLDNQGMYFRYWKNVH